MTGALGSFSEGALGKSTVKAVSGWSGSGSCGWWLVTNRKPECRRCARPSAECPGRAARRAAARAARTPSARSGARRSASSRCWSRSSWYEGPHLAVLAERGLEVVGQDRQVVGVAAGVRLLKGGQLPGRVGSAVEHVIALPHRTAADLGQPERSDVGGLDAGPPVVGHRHAAAQLAGGPGKSVRHSRAGVRAHVVGRRSAPMPSSSRSWVKKKCLRQVSGQPPSASVQNASG